MKLTSAQLGSWIKVLNIVRNCSAHHARMFNRVYTLKPRLPKEETHPELAPARKALNRSFGQLTLIQYLLIVLGVGDRTLLPRTLSTYPDVFALPISHMGTPKDWQTLPLWQSWTL